MKDLDAIIADAIAYCRARNQPVTEKALLDYFLRYEPDALVANRDDVIQRKLLAEIRALLPNAILPDHGRDLTAAHFRQASFAALRTHNRTALVTLGEIWEILRPYMGHDETMTVGEANALMACEFTKGH
jgi:hypothetical protein